MSSRSLTLVVVCSALLMGCGERNNPAPTSSAPSASPPTTVGAAPATTDRESPPAATPATHNQAPEPPASTSSAPTARDTPASRPTGSMTAAEESKSMPKPGQTDNHFTPSIDGATKGTQQSPGNTPATTGPPPKPQS